MKLYILSILCLLAPIWCKADTMPLNYRYWFDSSYTDSRIGQLLPGSNIIEIDASSLSQAQHSVSFQFFDKNGENISSPFTSFFTKAAPHDGYLILNIDNKSYTEKNVSYQNESIKEVIDIDGIASGIHTLTAYLKTRDGEISIVGEQLFLKMLSHKDLSSMSCHASIDNETSISVPCNMSDGLLQASLNASNIPDGVHSAIFTVTSSDGMITDNFSALFVKTLLGGNGITHYDYWINDDYTHKRTAIITDSVTDHVSLLTLLPVESYPLKSNSFFLSYDTSERPTIYAKNQANIMFYDRSGKFTIATTPYIDYNVKQTVAPIDRLQSGETKKMDNWQDNEIRWYTIDAAFGDSLTFKSDKAATLQLFSPDLKEIMSAQGIEITSGTGIRATADGEYYLAVHDCTDPTYGIQFTYNLIDKFALISHTPSKSGDSGITNIDMWGNGFEALKEVALVNGSGILKPEKYVVMEHNSFCVASFNFSKDKPKQGTYNLLLTFSDKLKGDSTIVMEDAFTVEPTISGDVLTKLSYNVFRDGNQPHHVYVKVINESNTGGRAFPMNVAVSGNPASIRFNGWGIAVDNPDYQEPVISGHVDNLAGLGVEADLIPIILPYLGPKETITLDFEINMGYDYDWNKNFGVYAWIGRYPYSERLVSAEIKNPTILPLDHGSLPPAVNIGQDCDGDSNIGDVYDAIDDLEELLGSDTFDKAALIAKLAVGTGEAIAGEIQAMSRRGERELESMGAAPLGYNVSEYSYKYRYQARSPYEIIGEFIPGIDRDILRDILRAHGIISCPQPNGWEIPHVPLSWDPNDIQGFTNQSGSHYIGLADKDLTYVIEFENDSLMATMPANRIILENTLDPDIFDLSTYRPTAMKFGPYKVDLDNTANFVRTVDMRPAINAIADISHTLDMSTGHSKWEITAIDPITLDPIKGKMYGILAVNNTDGDGQGYVEYEVRLKDGLRDGQKVENSANIIFDSNEALQTPIWHNETDYICPSSAITAVSVLDSNHIKIEWRGDDNRSGIWKYTLYYRPGDSSDWFELASETESTEHTLEVYDDINYAFCVLATDMAGNIERKELSPEYTFLNGNATAHTDSIIYDPDDDESGDWFDLQGRKIIGHPSHGIYIRKGSKIHLRH